MPISLCFLNLSKVDSLPSLHTASAQRLNLTNSELLFYLFPDIFPPLPRILFCVKRIQPPILNLDVLGIDFFVFIHTFQYTVPPIPQILSIRLTLSRSRKPQLFITSSRDPHF